MRFSRSVYLLLLGALCYTITQVCLRIPLLQWALGPKGFLPFFLGHPVLLWSVLVVTAGIFEEGGRFLFRRYLLKDSVKLAEPVLFGLGHSLAEIVSIFLPIFLANGMGTFQLLDPLAPVERLIATAFHILATCIIWDGFIRGRKWTFLLVAVLLHSLVDSIVPLGNILRLPLPIVEACFALCLIPAALTAWRWNALEH